MNKALKGVSPLIATLLLIAVALVLAGILYTWSSVYFTQQISQIEEATTAQAACAFAGLDIDDSTNSATRCDFNATDRPLDSLSRLTFKLSNTGTVDFNGDLTITASDGNTVVTLVYTPNLSKGVFVQVNCTNTTTPTNNCSRTSTADLNLLTSLTSLRVTSSDCPTKYAESSNCSTST